MVEKQPHAATEHSTQTEEQSSRPLRRRRRLRPRKLNLSKTLFVLPNSVTLAGLFCGFSAIRLIASPQAGEQEFYEAAIFLLLSMFFDLMDGRVARMTKTQSSFGLQLDSLADLISFGAAPALLVYQWVLHRVPVAGVAAAFSFLGCAAIRLARFNVLSSNAEGEPETPGKYIVGLPSPPASGILISLVVASHAMNDILSEPQYTGSILVMTIFIALLMVSNVKFRSFKDLGLNRGTMVFVAFVLLSSALVWQKFNPQFVFVWLLSLYVLIAVVEGIRELARKITPGAKRN